MNSSDHTKRIAQSLAVGAALLVPWLIFQVLINLILTLAAHAQGLPEIWVTYAKAILSPGASALLALTMTHHYFARAHWPAVAAAFSLAIAASFVWSVSFSSEYYLLAGRVDEWHTFLWEAVAGLAAGFVGEMLFFQRQEINVLRWTAKAQ